MIRRIFALALLLGTFAVSPAFADPMKFVLAAASSSGTYAEMLKQIIGVCGAGDFTIEEAAVKGGATDNLAALG
jgi:TRAP-type uncharacterized transport system substrate-binding protein